MPEQEFDKLKGILFPKKNKKQVETQPSEEVIPAPTKPINMPFKT